MSKRDLCVPRLHMRDHAEEALLLFSAGKKRSDLDTDRQLQLALVHLVQIIGEAARRLPAKERANHPAVPWNQIQGARNRLVHDYDEVDLDIVWEIVTKRWKRRKSPTARHGRAPYLEFNRAASYSPTQLPTQYHRG